MKSQKDIQDEIGKLKALKPRIPRRTFFGDDNHTVIDAEIVTLERLYTREEVYDEFSADDEEEPRELDAALGTANWIMEEDGSEAPSVGWEGLVK